jgi:hypothetical protein
MISKAKERLFRYTLRALPNGKYNFVKFDPEDATARGEFVLPDRTENEVRELYRAKWNFSEAEIEGRLQAARAVLKDSGRN